MTNSTITLSNIQIDWYDNDTVFVDFDAVSVEPQSEEDMWNSLIAAVSQRFGAVLELVGYPDCEGYTAKLKKQYTLEAIQKFGVPVIGNS